MSCWHITLESGLCCGIYAIYVAFYWLRMAKIITPKLHNLRTLASSIFKKKSFFVCFFVTFCWPWESEQWWQVWSFSLTFLFFMSLHHAVWLTCLNFVGFLIEGYFCFHFAWTFSYYSQISVSVALCGGAIFLFVFVFAVFSERIVSWVVAVAHTHHQCHSSCPFSLLWTSSSPPHAPTTPPLPPTTPPQPPTTPPQPPTTDPLIQEPTNFTAPCFSSLHIHRFLPTLCTPASTTSLTRPFFCVCMHYSGTFLDFHIWLHSAVALIQFYSISFTANIAYLIFLLSARAFAHNSF